MQTMPSGNSILVKHDVPANIACVFMCLQRMVRCVQMNQTWGKC